MQERHCTVTLNFQTAKGQKDCTASCAFLATPDWIFFVNENGGKHQWERMRIMKLEIHVQHTRDHEHVPPHNHTTRNLAKYCSVVYLYMLQVTAAGIFRVFSCKYWRGTYCGNPLHRWCSGLFSSWDHVAVRGSWFVLRKSRPGQFGGGRECKRHCLKSKSSGWGFGIASSEQHTAAPHWFWSKRYNLDRWVELESYSLLGSSVCFMLNLPQGSTQLTMQFVRWFS